MIREPILPSCGRLLTIVGLFFTFAGLPCGAAICFVGPGGDFADGFETGNTSRGSTDAP